jgi:hypothetical protein
MSNEEAPVVVETPGGLSVSYKGRSLYSDRDPARLPRRAALACDPEPQRLHLVASPLLWYGLPELLARMGRGSKVLCVEADPKLAELSRRSAPPGVFDGDRVSFIASDSPEEVAAAARELGRFRACAFLALSGGAALSDGRYRRMADLVRSEIAASWRNRASLMSMGRLWAKNIFDNIAALDSISPTPFPRFSGATAVCGAGPSLEEALPFLERNRGALSIVACDTALGTLLGRGISPDLVVCLEAQAHNLPDFVPLGERPVSLAADISSHPATFRVVRGAKHLSLVRITDSPFLERVASFARSAAPHARPMPPLGSVGVHAARLARELSAGPVLAFGLDFSFEAGKTHARGSPSLLAGERVLGRLDRWQAQYGASLRGRSAAAPAPLLADGRRLLSDPVLLSYAGLLSELSKEPGPPLYDARSRGPAIGAPRVDPTEAERLVRDAARAARPIEPPNDGTYGKGGSISEASRAFLAAEVSRLDALYDIMKGRSPPGSREALAGLVGEADYLYWGFPDADRARDLPQDFLNRLLPEVEWWAQRIARLEDDLAG